MIDYRMCIAVLARANHIKPVNRAFTALVIQGYSDVVTRERGAQVNRSRVVT